MNTCCCTATDDAPVRIGDVVHEVGSCWVMTPEQYLVAVAEQPSWRPCHRCGRRFEPEKGGQYHCSDECAAHCLAARA